jgi:hypothetical protein
VAYLGAPAGQLHRPAGGNHHPARTQRARAAVGRAAGLVLNHAHSIVCRDPLALTLYAVLALTVVGALVGIF